MMQLRPVASATPTGFTRINRRFRPILMAETEKVEAAEIRYEKKVQAIVSKRGIYTKRIRSKAPTPNTIGSRRAVAIKLNHDEQRDDLGGNYRRSAESRSHSRAKAQRRRYWNRKTC